MLDQARSQMPGTEIDLRIAHAARPSVTVAPTTQPHPLLREALTERTNGHCVRERTARVPEATIADLCDEARF